MEGLGAQPRPVQVFTIMLDDRRYIAQRPEPLLEIVTPRMQAEMQQEIVRGER